MDECGVNSNWLKQKTIKIFLMDDKVSKLDTTNYNHIILVVDRINVRKEYKDKTVVFNHRDAYLQKFGHGFRLWMKYGNREKTFRCVHHRNKERYITNEKFDRVE